MPRILSHISTGAVALLLSGCLGAGDYGVADPNLGDAPGLPGPTLGSGNIPGPSEAEDTPAFSVQKNQVTLLPFQIRFAKVARVLGVSAEHPALAELDRHRFELGDHDFANGIVPDRTWTASRLALWVKSLKPVCASAELKARYPAFPADLNAFILDAYGRAATDEDVLAFQQGFAELSLDEASQYQATCLAVLSATEFVSR